MKTTEIKLDLHDKIEKAAAGQLKDIYGLIINYFNGFDVTEEWDLLSDQQKKSITHGLEQADSGLGRPLSEINQRLRNKYGING